MFSFVLPGRRKLANVWPTADGPVGHLVGLRPALTSGGHQELGNCNFKAS